MSANVDCFVGDATVFDLLRAAGCGRLRRVIADNASIARRCADLADEVLIGNPNRLSFEPAPVALSLHCRFRLGAGLLGRYRFAYNLHPGFLPWARGPDPEFWTLWERAPAGASLHLMDSGLDTGPLIAQLRVEYDEGDGRAELRARVREAEARLLATYWSAIAGGEALTTRAQAGGGFYRSQRDLVALVRRVGRDPGRAGLDGAGFLRLVQCLGRLDVDIGGHAYTVYASRTS